MSLTNTLVWMDKHQDLIFPIGTALVARIVLSLFGALVVATTTIQPHLEFYNHALTPLAPEGPNVLIVPFERWDVIWYEIIATRGYIATDPSAAFFPLFPLLARVLSPNPGDILLASTILATLAASFAFVLLYRVTRQLFDIKTAQLAVVTWAAFPTAFYLFVPYAESLFVLLAIACLESARRNRLVAAGIMGGLAALTRSPGVWLVAPLGIAWLAQAHSQNWITRVRTLCPLLLVPLGVGLYMIYLQVKFGDALLWVHALAVWENRFSFPWDTIFGTVREILSPSDATRLNNLLDLLATVFVFGMVLRGLLPRNLGEMTWHGWQPYLPLSFGIYGLVFVLLPLTLVGCAGDLQHLPMANAARRAVVIFPAFILAGRYLQGRFRAPLWLSLSVGLQCIFVYIFVRWLWVD